MASVRAFAPAWKPLGWCIDTAESSDRAAAAIITEDHPT
jgi:hypothetical protein